MVEQGGLENGSPPAGSCTYKNWFLCIICLYVIAKTYTEIEKTYSYAPTQAALLEGSGLGSDEGGVI